METPIGVRASGPRFLIERWFLPLKRSVGTWAFVFNRWTGVLLAIYLYVHLGILTTIAFSPSAYDQFLVLARSPLGLAFDVVLVALLLYHGLNGLRIVYASLAGRIEQQRAQFWVVIALTIVITLYGGYLIFSFE